MMNCSNKCSGHKNAHSNTNRGKTSYHMQKSSMVFDELMLKQGDCVLDLGCGAGDYSMHASKTVGQSGSVYSVDGSKDTIEYLSDKIKDESCPNIYPMKLDFVKEKLSFDDNKFDYCFIFTVLHALEFPKAEKMFAEIRRVLKRDAYLAVIDCNKDNLDYGPPIEMRVSADEVEELVKPYGFMRISDKNLGFNYLVQFKCEK